MRTFEIASIKAKKSSCSVKKNGVSVYYDDDLTDIERIQRASSIPASLIGSAKPSKVKSDIRLDLYSITGDEYFFSPSTRTPLLSLLSLVVSLILLKAGSGV
jgi:hypothetical protein